MVLAIKKTIPVSNQHCAVTTNFSFISKQNTAIKIIYHLLFSSTLSTKSKLAHSQYEFTSGQPFYRSDTESFPAWFLYHSTLIFHCRMKNPQNKNTIFPANLKNHANKVSDTLLFQPQKQKCCAHHTFTFEY